jgi:hypothetical protein
MCYYIRDSRTQKVPACEWRAQASGRPNTLEALGKHLTEIGAAQFTFLLKFTARTHY